MSSFQEAGYSWNQLLRILRCPICHQPMKFDPVDQGLPHAREYGILSCECARYPVIDGVPVLKRSKVGVFEHTLGGIEYEGPSPEDLTRLVLGGKGLDALLLCIGLLVTTRLLTFRGGMGRSRRVREFLTNLRCRQLRKWCVADRDTLTAEDWFNVFYRRFSPISGDLFNYFLRRFAQPRHLAALVLMRILPKSDKPVLDLPVASVTWATPLRSPPQATEWSEWTETSFSSGQRSIGSLPKFASFAGLEGKSVNRAGFDIEDISS